MGWMDHFLDQMADRVARRAAQFQEVAQQTAQQLRFDAGAMVNAFTGLGGMHDKGSAGRPNLGQKPLTDQELDCAYETMGLARRIIDLKPERATRNGWTAPDLGETDKDLKTQWNFFRAGSLSRLFGGCPMLIVTEDHIPSSFNGRETDWLAEPLDLDRVQKVHSIQHFDAWSAHPMVYDEDVRSANFRGPKIWSFNEVGFTQTVHHSRVLWFRGRERIPSKMRLGARNDANRMPDQSILQAVWDEIRRLLSTHQGGAVLAQELMQNVLKVGDLPATLAGDDAAAFRSRIALMSRSMSLMNMAVIGPSDEFHKTATPATGFGELAAEMRTMVAAVSEYPEVVLFGTTPGGLNTDGKSGWEGFHQSTSAYQKDHLLRHLQRLYQVMYRAKQGPTRGKEPKQWDVTFNPLDEPTELDRAQAMLFGAQTDQIYSELGVYDAIDIAEQRFGQDGWRLQLEVKPPTEEDLRMREEQRMPGFGQMPPGFDDAHPFGARSGDEE